MNGRMDKWRVQWGQGEVSRAQGGDLLAGAGLRGPEEAEIPGKHRDLPGLRAPAKPQLPPSKGSGSRPRPLARRHGSRGSPLGPEDGSPPARPDSPVLPA